MPTPTRTKQRKPAKPRRKRAPTLAYDKLLKLAPKMKPPQTWYDEGVNPSEPEEKSRKRRWSPPSLACC
jgi:hypothetical protein